MAFENISQDLTGRSGRGVHITTDEPRFATRFWSKVAVTADPERCWVWQASTYSNGYGRIWVDGAVRLAHRVVWKLIHGYYSDLLILHACDVRACCNPKHLREGTHVENTQDAMNRHRFSLPPIVAKVTEDQVREIRTLRDAGMSLRSIAQLYNIGFSTAGAIYHRQTWKHVI